MFAQNENHKAIFSQAFNYMRKCQRYNIEWIKGNIKLNIQSIHNYVIHICKQLCTKETVFIMKYFWGRELWVVFFLLFTTLKIFLQYVSITSKIRQIRNTVSFLNKHRVHKVLYIFAVPIIEISNLFPKSLFSLHSLGNLWYSAT